MKLIGNMINENDVNEKGDEPIRVKIRPIFCMNCGTRKLLGYNLADEGYIDERELLTVLQVSVCKECVKNYAEMPEEGWKTDKLKEAIELCGKLIGKALTYYEVDTIEELNEIVQGAEVLEQELSNGLVALLTMIEDTYYLNE